MHTLRALGLLVPSLLAAACVGGPGAVGDPPNTYDRASTAVERPGASSDRAQGPATGTGTGSGTGSGTGTGTGTGGGASPAPAPSSTAKPASFDCSGSLTCAFTVNGKTQSDSVPLATKGDDCVAGSGEDELVLASGGVLTKAGAPVGTWVSTGGGVTLTVQGQIIACTR
jgi:hypothetical protein